MSTKYKQSGVDLQAGYKSVELIKKHVERTSAFATIGSFGGVFDLSALNYKEPMLISGTDGVGTKLEIASKLGIHDTIGIDLVAMCVNDIITQGAKPLYFLDYIAVGKNIPEKIEKIVKGIADGCVESECSLIGGETAEMPDIYEENQYDLAGFTVGCVEKSEIITGENVSEGDILIGISSSGIHSNGYSLVRKILLHDNDYDLNKVYPPLQNPLGEVLLTPTKIYVKAIMELIKLHDIKAIAHITGGGFIENIPRVLNKGLGVKIDKTSFEIPAIFKLLQEAGEVLDEEMFNVFNMGIGMVVVVEENIAEDVLKTLNSLGEKSYIIGTVTSEEGVEII